MDTIKGYIQQEPEMRFTPNGTAITSIRISENKNDEDYKKYKRIIAWESLAEVANEILQVEDFIYAKGYWKTRSWEGQDGEPHTVKEFTAKQIWNEKYEEIEETTDLPF